MAEPVCLIENDEDGDLSVQPQAAEIPEQTIQPEMTWESITSSSTIPMAEPVCLIENDEDGNLSILPQAAEILEQIDQRVVVVAVVGRYRTGKSYLMNKMAGERKGFALGSTIQSKTKGIWMWCVPHPKKADHTLVVLDTEGLGDVEKGDSKNDNWIFSLAVLLSSALVYNSVGTIDNDALQQLHYVTELTEHIKVKSSNTDEDESTEFTSFFPSFVWTVRDFTLELEYNGEPITADEYLARALELKPGCGKSVVLYNMPRECIRNYFPKRKCFVFDRPTSAENMKHMDDLSDEDLDPLFVQQARNFCDYVFEEARTKTMKGGYEMTGRMLGRLAAMFVDSIGNGLIPCLENAVVTLAEIENSNAVAKAVKFYQENMAAFVVFPTDTQEELSQIHAGIEKQAVEIFMDHCFKDKDQKSLLELTRLIQTEYGAICEKNISESRAACEAVIKQIFRPLEENIEFEQYMSVGGYNDYYQDLQNCIMQYELAEGKGIKEKESLDEYLAKKESVGRVIMCADKSLSDAQRREKENQMKIETMKREQITREVENETLKNLMVDQERSTRETIEQLEKKMEEEKKNAAAELEGVLQVKLREQQALLRQGFQKKASLMEQEIDSLKKQKAEYELPAESSFLSDFGHVVGKVFEEVVPPFIKKGFKALKSYVS